MFAPALSRLGLSNKNKLTWQNMLSCSYFFLMRVWEMQKVVVYDAQHLQYASCIRWLLVPLWIFFYITAGQNFVLWHCRVFIPTCSKCTNNQTPEIRFRTRTFGSLPSDKVDEKYVRWNKKIQSIQKRESCQMGWVWIDVLIMDWNPPLPRSWISFPMCFQGGFGVFIFYES